MKIGVLGTGMVGDAIASKLVSHGHEVMMGSRTTNNEKAIQWAGKLGPKATHGNFAEASAFGELVFNCTQGVHALDALKLAGDKNLEGKILIDISNPLDFSKGAPPSLYVSNTDSLGEQIQRAFPKARVIKTLNTLSCYLMVNPSLVPGDHDIFVCGNDAAARNEVIGFLVENFGWEKTNIVDLGDITNARGTESLLPIWIRLWGKFQNPMFNFHIVVGPCAQAVIIGPAQSTCLGPSPV